MIKKSQSCINVIPSTLASLLFILQIIVGIYLLSGVSQIAIFAYIGVGLYVFSGIDSAKVAFRLIWGRVKPT